MEALLGYGVPAEWVGDVQKAGEDTILTLADHLPSEAAEALLDLATGVTPQPVQPVIAGVDPFDHPDAQRRFRVMRNIEELERALEYPWEKWTVFLHPAQRQLVERQYSGPARVSGSAGTGKTIVALHRAVFLARNNPDARVLLTTFSDPLANALRTKLKRLINHEPRLGERLDVHAMNAIGRRLHELHFGRQQIAYSRPSRPPIPFHSGHSFHLKSATDSRGILPPFSTRGRGLKQQTYVERHSSHPVAPRAWAWIDFPMLIMPPLQLRAVCQPV